MNEMGRHTIPYGELPELLPAGVLTREWDSYRREVGRLLAEGHEGKFVLIKGEDVIGVHDAWDAAREMGLRLYLVEPFLVQEVRAQEPVLRLRGYSFPCPE